MKKHLVFISIIAILTGLLLIFPFSYRFSEPVKELPKFITYKKALLEILPSELNKHAKNHKCKDYIIPVSEIEGNYKIYQFLADDINIAAQTFHGWKLLVDRNLKEKMKKRVEERIHNWGPMGVGREIKEILETQKKIAMKTRYSIVAKCDELRPKEIDNIKLVVSINNEKTQENVFSIPVFFTSQEKIISMKNERKNALKKRQPKFSKIFPIMSKKAFFCTHQKK
ncbi:MAG: hypothetical protein CSA18_04500 [Deltaproteobacteria bacterium]|nr:MAG: hypothetical protein CSB21_01495 [Deltaproteobacteria bacterium]PIE74541.1 MAG: hypothetical protein CSA18_04500 [Deltaproteobacteria bacterium]